MDGNDASKKLVCCFWGNNLEIENAVLLQVYPQINGDESQELFCHKKCLRDGLHESVPVHPDLLDDEI